MIPTGEPVTTLNERQVVLQREALAAGEPPPSRAATALAALCVPLRLVLAGVFLFAAWQKAGDASKPQFFSESVKALWTKSLGTPLGFALPDHLMQVITFCVPWIEVVAAVLLLVGLWTRSAATVIFTMLLGFTSMYIAVILRHEDVKCGCFGKSQLLCSGGVGWCHVGQNLALAAMALVIMLTARHVLAVDRRLARCG
jgi:uncharacterized membrane protein YphA (DoxX/SURF4 family)